MDDRDRDLAEATAELNETLEALKTELTEPPDREFKPPTPRELLRFTEQYTIPTTIALLEAGIRSLELLAAALRAADGRPIDAVSGELGTEGRDRLAATSRETLHRLDDALAELQSAARGEPSAPEIAHLLTEARELRAEVDDRLADAIDGEPRRSGPDPGAGSRVGSGSENTPSEHGADDTTEIDVDEELESIKRTVEGSSDDDGSPAGDTSDDGSGS